MGESWHDGVVHDGAKRRVDDHVDRDEQQRPHDEHEADLLESSEAPGADRADDDQRRDDHRGQLREPQIAGRERDADELGDDRQGVEDEQVDDAERPPEPAESLEDQPRVADPGHDAESEHHLLADVQDGDEQQQRPDEAGPEVLPCLPVGAERARVVVPDHHDQPGPDDREERQQPPARTPTRADVVNVDRAEPALDVAHVRAVQHRRGLLGDRLVLTAHRRCLVKRSRGMPASCWQVGAVAPEGCDCVHLDGAVRAQQVLRLMSSPILDAQQRLGTDRWSGGAPLL